MAAQPVELGEVRSSVSGALGLSPLLLAIIRARPFAAARVSALVMALSKRGAAESQIVD